MHQLIQSVRPGSPAFKAGIVPGQRLISINGHIIRDVLDFQFYGYDSRLDIVLEDQTGERREVSLRKRDGADPGIEFETYLMDKQKSCCNKCVFCFVDQLAPDMRESLYFKDDDARLSFLLGNYITLTNLTDEDAARIIEMKINPLNISVHTTDPELRSFMLGNRRGGQSLKLLSDFADAGIGLNCQVVVCPGINDGAHLQKTLTELLAMQPAVLSIAVVPVGLTKWRGNLHPLNPVDEAAAREIIGITDSLGAANIEKYGTRLVYAADELYLKAGIEIPGFDFFEDFPQLENGVGMWAIFKDEFNSAIETNLSPKGQKSIVTGTGIAPLLRKLLDDAGFTCDNVLMHPIPNQLFGNMVDVAGLVGGADIISELRGEKIGGCLLIPASMLRHGGDLFIDSTSPADIERELGVSVRVVEVDGGALADAICD